MQKSLMIIGGIMLLTTNFWFAVSSTKYRKGKAKRLAMGRRYKQQSGRGISDLRMLDKAYRYVSEKKGWLGSFYEKVVLKVKQAGYFSERAGLYYLIIQLGVPFLVFILMILSGRDLLLSLLTSFGSCMVPYIFLKGKAIERKKSFQKTSYKTYKYLSSQVASGVTPFNAMRGVYQAVDDEDVSYALAAFVAKYELTQNIEESSKELKQRFDSSEAETLTIAFEQGIKTGDNAEILDLQEAIMFDNYVNIIQQEFKKANIFAFLAGLLFAIGAIIVMCIPLIIEMFDGFNTFFTN